MHFILVCLFCGVCVCLWGQIQHLRHARQTPYHWATSQSSIDIEFSRNIIYPMNIVYLSIHLCIEACEELMFSAIGHQTTGCNFGWTNRQTLPDISELAHLPLYFSQIFPQLKRTSDSPLVWWVNSELNVPFTWTSMTVLYGFTNDNIY